MYCISKVKDAVKTAQKRYARIFGKHIPVNINVKLVIGDDGEFKIPPIAEVSWHGKSLKSGVESSGKATLDIDTERDFNYIVLKVLNFIGQSDIDVTKEFYDDILSRIVILFNTYIEGVKAKTQRDIVMELFVELSDDENTLHVYLVNPKSPTMKLENRDYDLRYIDTDDIFIDIINWADESLAKSMVLQD